MAETNSATLYEDDTQTTAYQRGEFRDTRITASAGAADKTVRVEIGAAAGNFSGALPARAWTLRIHPPPNWSKDLKPTTVTLNGRPVNLSDEPVQRLVRAQNALPLGDKPGAPDGDVFEFNLPTAPVSKSQEVEMTFAR